MTKYISLKELNVQDVGQNYINWMNDSYVTKYTNQKKKKFIKENIKSYVLKKKKSSNEFLYGIYVGNLKKTHVGNIKLGPIKNKSADISYVLSRKFWGKKIATNAIKKIITISKKKFKLKNIKAGVLKENKASIAVLKKNNFICYAAKKKKKIPYYRYKLTL
jgi:ribosomal-protein-alanine N-acetyltransferase